MRALAKYAQHGGISGDENGIASCEYSKAVARGQRRDVARLGCIDRRAQANLRKLLRPTNRRRAEAVARWKAMRVLARCRLLLLTSKLEGGANVISEALALSVPVLSSRIAGSVGLLGKDYPGYFPVGDTAALARLLERAEIETEFYRTLQDCCGRLRTLIDSVHERESWKAVLCELSGQGTRFAVE